MEKIIKEFQTYLLIEKGLQLSSVDAYCSDISLFAKEYPLLQVDFTDIKNYIALLNQQNIAATSIKRKVTALKSFYHHLYKIKMIAVDPTLKIQLNKCGNRLPTVFSLAEYEKMIATCDVNNVNGLKDKMILELLFGCGLRVSELVNLKLNDINFTQNIIKVTGKGNRQRLIPIPPVALELVNRYCYQIRIKDNNKYLLTTRNGNKMSRCKIYDIIIMRGQKAGLNKKITPHTFRHSAATMLLENGVDLKTLQEFLGHADITTTKIYTHIQTKSLKQGIAKYHPRLKKEDI